MPSTRFNTHQLRSTLRLLVLQLGYILERVGRHYTIIVVASHYQDGWILNVRADIVEWRIGIQILEALLGVFASPIVASPSPTDRELLITEHIHYTNLRNCYTKEVWALIGYCAY